MNRLLVQFDELLLLLLLLECWQLESETNRVARTLREANRKNRTRRHHLHLRSVVVLVEEVIRSIPVLESRR